MRNNSSTTEIVGRINELKMDACQPRIILFVLVE